MHSTTRKRVISIQRINFTGGHITTELTEKLNQIREETADKATDIMLNTLERLKQLDEYMEEHQQDHEKQVDFWHTVARTTTGSVRQEALQWLAYNNY